MRKFFYLSVLVLMAALFSMPILAQPDTLDITPNPVGNINTVINGDTTAGGLRAHPERVYRLGRGFVYQVTEPIKINGPLKVVATEGTDRPPVLAPAILGDNSSIDHFFEFRGKGAAVELSNIYLLSVRSDQNWLGWSAGIRIQADSIQLKLRGVIFDAFSESGIRVYSHWTKLDVQDCYFRNHQHSSSWFGGQPFMTDAPNHMDTVVFINNTFFANNSYSFSIRGYDRFSRFEHNTMVYGTVNPFLVRQASHLWMKNNLFYDMHAMGGNPEHVINGWFLNYPDTVASGIIHIRTRDSVSAWFHSIAAEVPITGPEAYLDEARGVTSDLVSASNRWYDISNNAYFWSQELKDFYTSWNDTVQTRDTVISNTGTVHYVPRTLTLPVWITEYSQYSFDSLLAGLANITMVNNIEADPAFNTDIMNFKSSLIDYVRKISQTGGPDVPWHYPSVGSLYPPAWPLPENLRYTNSALMTAGSDGLPLGDLNWFPELKPTGVKPNSKIIPEKFSLSETYPNPFNPETFVKFNIPLATSVKIVVYNLLGQKVKTLFDGELKAGGYNASWNGTDDYGNHVSSGIYFMSLESQSYKAIRKMVLMK